MIRKSIITISLLFGLNNLMANEAPALPVETFKVTQQTNTTNKTYPTILKAYEQVDVMARVSGTLTKKTFYRRGFCKKRNSFI